MTDPGPKLTRTEACHMLIVLAVVCFFVALFFIKVLFEDGLIRGIGQ